MNQEYKIRNAKAFDVNNKIHDLCEGLMIVGSVAYNPNAVTEKSDLDLVGISDFSRLDFKELYKRLHKKYEPLIANYASKIKFNTFSILSNDKFEIGLHLWDKTAFENVINLNKYNLVFARDSWIGNKRFISTNIEEREYNLNGEEKIIKKSFEKVNGGRIVRFYPYYQDKRGFYLGIQAANLLLGPVILNQKNSYLSDGIEKFRKNIENKLIEIYNKNHSKSTSLLNAIAPKIKEKISETLKKRLNDFF